MSTENSSATMKADGKGGGKGMAGYRRARSAEQKAERMAEIMGAAERLFEAGSYHGITLATIAAELSWSRGNLYNYVETKEEVFLAI
ncbi:MAG: helix-turn-helix transcriptional regulator, partial [Eggerthellaceae bacterium]|nr:helix-turn-helix transcriptional regulator [Eggerthellaceae bacterium]